MPCIIELPGVFKFHIRMKHRRKMFLHRCSKEDENRQEHSKNLNLSDLFCNFRNTLSSERQDHDWGQGQISQRQDPELILDKTTKIWLQPIPQEKEVTQSRQGFVTLDITENPNYCKKRDKSREAGGAQRWSPQKNISSSTCCSKNPKPRQCLEF